jgi:hypothetical protein
MGATFTLELPLAAPGKRIHRDGSVGDGQANAIKPRATAPPRESAAREVFLVPRLAQQVAFPSAPSAGT